MLCDSIYAINRKFASSATWSYLAEDDDDELWFNINWILILISKTRNMEYSLSQVNGSVTLESISDNTKKLNYIILCLVE